MPGSAAPTDDRRATINQIDTPISVIVPAYNEQDGIRLVLDQFQQGNWFQDIAADVELIIVDDGSQDRTASVISEYTDIVLLQHPYNRGYGAALKTGIRHASHPIICITDADGTYPNELIPELVALLVNTKIDMAVGARTGPGAAIPLIRRPAKWFINQLANLVAGQPIPDLNSGLRVFWRSAALPFFNILPDGFSFTTTLTLGMLTNGYLVGYVPINYHARIGKSKIRPIRDTLGFIQLVLRIALYFSPLKIFLPLSGFLVLLAVLWAVCSRFILGQLADVSTLVLIMAGVQVGVIGLLAELINQRLPNMFERNNID